MLRDSYRTSSPSQTAPIPSSPADPVKDGKKHLSGERSGTRDLAVSLLKKGYQDAYVDLARSEASLLMQKEYSHQTEPHSGKAEDAHQQHADRHAPGKRMRLREEMPRAIAAYDHAVSCVRDFMATASQGRLDAAPALEAVVGLVDSLERNVDALLCLPRMRQRDAYLYTHCVNVSVLLAAYALVSGEGRDRVMTNAVAGIFHDIGKALLPVALLSARRKLSLTEQTLVMRHPMLGSNLLSTFPSVQAEVLQAALEHHERFDGSGYPKGLAGKAISHMGRLTAIADTYDALSSRRPYKGALFPHKTLGVLYQLRQSQFHPDMVETFVRMIGIYPVGSVVELKDGYRGVVTGSNFDNPMLPVVTLALDPQGGTMCAQECDMAKEAVSMIVRCLPIEVSGIDPCSAMGITL
jgi:HD-GYP domain